MTETAGMAREEELLLSLRELYGRYGYIPFRMNRFEEYDLYSRNKDFLVSDQLLTFTDTNGRLMALKPDVTLSIIRSGEDIPGTRQKVSYSENVYRVSPQTHRFREIMQTGLECIGDIGVYDLFEVTALAAKTLAAVSPAWVLAISDIDLVAALMEELPAEYKKAVLQCLAEKNRHDLARICAGASMPQEAIARLEQLTALSGSRKNVLAALEPLCVTAETKTVLERLQALSALLDTLPEGKNIRYDFSLMNNMKYYNGLVLQGFIDGVPQSVLNGGQYSRLMERMGRRADALGFALYIDRLEALLTPEEAYDADVLLLCAPDADPMAIAARVSALTEAGERVSVQQAVPQALRFRRMETIGEVGVC